MRKTNRWNQQDRQLDNFFSLEEGIAKLPKQQLLDIINDEDKGKDPLDKLRLAIIWTLSTELEMSRADMDNIEESLKRAGADVTCLAYIRRGA